MKILAFAGSLREASLNRRLVRAAIPLLEAAGAEVDHADFHEFEMPPYDGDLESRDGIPAGATRLRERLAAADGLVLSSPEYNHSIPGTVKNAIDWVSRSKPTPLRGLPVLLLSASPSLVGGNRGLWALRVPLEALGASVHPDMYSLPKASDAFDDGGELVEESRRERLGELCAGFVRWAGALAELR